MEVRLLGPVDVMADDGSIVAVPGQKLQHLLAALAIERGRVVTTDRLVSIVYGEAPPRQPANSLQVLVSRLRRSLPTTGASAIETTDAGYRLAAGEAVRTDIERFNTLVAAARSLTGNGNGDEHDPAGAGAHLRDALDLVRG